MSIISEIRQRRRGQKAELEAKRKPIAAAADEALASICMKADALRPAPELDTQGILYAAQRLHDTAEELRLIDQAIADINTDLHG